MQYYTYILFYMQYYIICSSRLKGCVVSQLIIVQPSFIDTFIGDSFPQPTDFVWSFRRCIYCLQIGVITRDQENRTKHHGTERHTHRDASEQLSIHALPDM